MDYMRNGGINMWVMLIAAIAIAALAATRPRAARSGVLASGCVLMIIMGIFGLATGLQAVSNHYEQFPDKVAAIGVGLGELSNNGTFSSMLALLFGIASLVTKQKSGAPSPASS